LEDKEEETALPFTDFPPRPFIHSLTVSAPIPQRTTIIAPLPLPLPLPNLLFENPTVGCASVLCRWWGKMREMEKGNLWGNE
jgi:hypothetical protein